MLRTATTISLLVVLAAPAAAQSVPVVKSGDSLAFSALGHTLTFPPPAWLSAEDAAAADPLSVLEARGTDDGTTAKVDFIPKGQNFEDAPTRAFVEISRTPEKPLTRVRDEIALALSQTCQRQATSFFQLKEDGPDTLPVLGFACGAYLDTIGTLAGKGGITLVAFVKGGEAVATVTEVWRGSTFDITSPATWPVPSDVVQGRMGTLEAQVSVAAAPEPAPGG
jgi:hypothetical protein